MCGTGVYVAVECIQYHTFSFMFMVQGCFSVFFKNILFCHFDISLVSNNTPQEQFVHLPFVLYILSSYHKTSKRPLRSKEAFRCIMIENNYLAEF